MKKWVISSAEKGKKYLKAFIVIFILLIAAEISADIIIESFKRPLYKQMKIMKENMNQEDITMNKLNSDLHNARITDKLKAFREKLNSPDINKSDLAGLEAELKGIQNDSDNYGNYFFKIRDQMTEHKKIKDNYLKEYWDYSDKYSHYTTTELNINFLSLIVFSLFFGVFNYKFNGKVFLSILIMLFSIFINFFTSLLGLTGIFIILIILFKNNIRTLEVSEAPTP